MLVFLSAPRRVSLAMGDENERDTEGAVQDHFETWASTIDDALSPRVEYAVATNSTSALLDSPAWDLAWEAVNGPWNAQIGKYVATVGQKEIDRLRFPLNFKQDNPYATAWAKTQSAERVTQITAETKAALKNAIGAAFESGQAPAKLAAVVRQTIGLRDRDAQAVVNKALKALADGVSEAKVRADADRYSLKLLRNRSMLIARTETIDAGNQGLRASWQTARDAGLLSAETKRVWLAAPGDRTCEICSDFGSPANRETELDRPYQSTSHGELNGPTAHPGCRCTQGLKTERR